ncbi:MAG: class I SAM-dependent methyltransferase [Nanoarchaeota archaeon]
MKPDEEEAKNKYNMIAESYHNFRVNEHPNGWFYNEMLEMPAVLEMLGNVKGKKVLDFGCGTGIYTKILKEKGANIKGFDISPQMLKIAKDYVSNVEFKLGSGYKIPFNEKFDIAFASLVMHHMKDWDKVFGQLKKVLKPKGEFIFSISNPVAEITKKSEDKNPLIRKFERYFEERKIFGYWRNILKNKKTKIKMPIYHKTYETIIKTIVKNNFEIIDYKDCFPSQKSKKLFPNEYKFALNYPYFCVWKIRLK